MLPQKVKFIVTEPGKAKLMQENQLVALFTEEIAQEKETFPKE